jgi:hypothetical protein
MYATDVFVLVVIGCHIHNLKDARLCILNLRDHETDFIRSL